ncbi:MAG: polymer-forming cytoskeletal family protein [Candidatus Cloacimonadota bacterium]|nr:MAG: polymer-forming cytoskeletal family protein [Candidatus Cloacimonadota bacterium]PIE78952.1 MAG: polymer-forming cytoskeletal family protein [Candidatus Delongbacteria bacterium]
MGLFTKNDRESNIKNGKTIIASGTGICGNIEIECNLHIDGKIEGDINSKGSVIIGREGVVIGDIRANQVIVSGTVKGNISSGSVEIVSKGLIEGSVFSDNFIIDKEGVFKEKTKPIETENKKSHKPPKKKKKRK